MVPKSHPALTVEELLNNSDLYDQSLGQVEKV
jgi:hypothetical protein